MKIPVAEFAENFIKQGKANNKELEQLIELVYKQCDSVKNTAEMIESIGERINQM